MKRFIIVALIGLALLCMIPAEERREAVVLREVEVESEAPSIEEPVAIVRSDPIADRMEQQVDEDPIAQQVPMLSFVEPEMQLETLRWLEQVPEDKVVAAIPALLAERHLPMSVREEMARAMIGDMIRDLEARGVAAPRMRSRAPVARLLSSVREPYPAPLGGGSDRGRDVSPLP